MDDLKNYEFSYSFIVHVYIERFVEMKSMRDTRSLSCVFIISSVGQMAVVRNVFFGQYQHQILFSSQFL